MAVPASVDIGIANKDVDAELDADVLTLREREEAFQESMNKPITELQGCLKIHKQKRPDVKNTIKNVSARQTLERLTSLMHDSKADYQQELLLREGVLQIIQSYKPSEESMKDSLRVPEATTPEEKDWSRNSVRAKAMSRSSPRQRPSSPRRSVALGPEFDIEHYAKKNYVIHRHKQHVKELISYSSKMLVTSLTELNDDSAKMAVQHFRNITGYMGDRRSGKSEKDHATKLILQAIQEPQDLRDEIYCQLMKQTTRNMSTVSNKAGWQLMAMCISCFPPSKELDPYLRWHIRKHTSQPDIDTIDHYAKFYMTTLDSTMAQWVAGPRAVFPKEIEEQVTSFERTFMVDHLSFITRETQAKCKTFLEDTNWNVEKACYVYYLKQRAAGGVSVYK